MREEITPVFYSFNTFTIITKYLEVDFLDKPEDRRPFFGIKTWLKTIGERNIAHLSRVCIDLGWYTVEGSHERITQFLNIAKAEIDNLIITLHLPAQALVLRAAMFAEVFPPIGHILRYIDVPVGDRKEAERNVHRITEMSKDRMPGYAVNRDVVFRTMDLFRDGVLEICFRDEGEELDCK